MNALITIVKKTIGQRIKERRESLGITQESLAKSIGVGQSSIGNYEAETRTPKHIHKIANALKVNIDWLETGLGEMLDLHQPISGAVRVISVSDDLNHGLSRIRRVSIRASAGISGYEIDQTAENIDSEPIYFKKSWINSNGYKETDLIAIKISGESMEPGLCDSDIIVLNTGNTILKDGCAYVFNLDGEIVVKRAIKDAGQWWLDSDNPNKARFPRKSCSEGHCIVIGKVVQKQSMRI